MHLAMPHSSTLQAASQGIMVVIKIDLLHTPNIPSLDQCELASIQGVEHMGDPEQLLSIE
jgi:hypothetical protein